MKADFKFMKGINAGEKNWNWKGDNVSRAGIHQWLVRIYGRPNKCEICGLIGGRNINWAKLKGKEYERKRENFWRLCDKCHMNYDGVGKKGHRPYNTKPNSGSFKKGKHPSLKTEFKKGQHYNISTEFKKGIIPKNKGKKFVNGHYV